MVVPAVPHQVAVPIKFSRTHSTLVPRPEFQSLVSQLQMIDQLFVQIERLQTQTALELVQRAIVGTLRA